METLRQRAGTQPGASAHEPAEPARSAIRTIDLCKHFRAGGELVKAVDNINLDVGKGEFFSLLGPSGCGKSTTLRMVAGLEQPSSGQLLIDGKDVTRTRANQRSVNMVFQNYALFPHMNVFGNVAFGLRRRHVPKAEIRTRVHAMLELVELGGAAQRRPAQLSGGQQQRVALARALVNEPDALLLDEPLSALDLKLRQVMQVELKRIQREIGITFLYVTHDQGEALTMSDRIAVMHGGRVQQIGSPREIYERPATSFVANFIGTSNLLRGRVETVEEGVARMRLGSEDLILARAAVARVGAELELAVRPERMQIAPFTQPPADGCRIAAEVAALTYAGPVTRVALQAADGAVLAVDHHNATANDLTLEPGQRVWACWRSKDGFVIPRSQVPV